MHAGTIDELFAKTLLGELDDDAPWDAVRELRRIGSREVFEQAANWCRCGDPLQRTRGSDVLAQIGNTPEHPGNAFPDECFSTVREMLARETDPMPLSSAVYASGHIGNTAAVPLLLGFSSHPDADVRNALAFALGCFPNDAQALPVLLKLMRDPDEDVRDWATFAVSTLGDHDSMEVRDALAAAMNDPAQGVRTEAVVGLAKRKDPRAISPLLAALAEPEVTDITFEAATFLLDMQGFPKTWSPADYTRAILTNYPDFARE